MKKKSSLSFRLILTTNLIAGVILISMTVLVLSLQKKRYEEFYLSQMTTLSQTISLSVADYVWNINIKSIQDIADSIAKNGAIDSIQFTDTKDKLLAENVKIKNQKLSTPSVVNKIEFLNGTNREHIGFVKLKYNTKTIDQQIKQLFEKSLVFLLGAQFILTILIYVIIKNTTKKLALGTQKINELTHKSYQSSETAKKISDEVKNATQNQTSAIQETVSTIEQINSTVQLSNQKMESSSKEADQSHSIATNGKNVVRNMMTSMEEINESNKEIMHEIMKGNERIEVIVKIINEISNKTSVINDIVFQTKLLSFNASVEAARAGEHGKGFAVVAEEVGNLAQMSGKASTEITAILDESIHKVNAVINETKLNVEKLVTKGNDKVQQGLTIAGECEHVLNEIVINAENVKNMMNDLSQASKEQALAIKNISDAMNSINKNALSNIDSANKSALNSDEISLISKELSLELEQLKIEIFGGLKSNLQAEINHAPKIEKIEIVKSDKAIESKKDTAVQTKTVATPAKKEMIIEKPNVLELKKKEIPMKNTSPKATPHIPTSVELLAANGDLKIPDKNDPRFEEI